MRASRLMPAPPHAPHANVCLHRDAVLRQAADYLPLAICHLPLTTHHLPLTHYHSLLTICYVLLQLLDNLAAGNEVVVGPQNGLRHSEGPMGRTSLIDPPPAPTAASSLLLLAPAKRRPSIELEVRSAARRT